MTNNARTHPQSMDAASNPEQAGRGRWRAKATVANIAAGLVVLFALSGTAAAGTVYVISSNHQVGPATIAGHHNPAGDQANIIAGSINSTDIQTGSIGTAQLAAPEPWHAVAPWAPYNGLPNNCLGAIATFCGSGGVWANSGAPFAPGGFYRDAQSRVHLRGLVSLGSAVEDSNWTPIFYLPVGYRPGHELVFTTLDNNSAGSYLVRVDVDPSGSVHVVNDAEDNNGVTSWGGTFLSLDGISFRTGE